MEIPLVNRFPLHKAVFNHDIKSLQKLLKSSTTATAVDVDVNVQDVHGNTALHLAVMTGFKEAIPLLLSHGALTRLKNNDGWNVLLESISYGNRDTITTLLKGNKVESKELLASRKPHLLEMLRNMDDFYLELKWDFQTWIPLLSRMLPSDVCKIYKYKSALRMDTTLIDFNEQFTWERGDVTFLYNPAADNKKTGQHLVLMDNKKEVFQRIMQNTTHESKLEEDVNMLMSHEIATIQTSTKPITFVPAMSGWIFKQKRSEYVGGLSATYYMVEGLTIVMRHRREHLSVEDIRKNKAFMKSLTSVRPSNDMAGEVDASLSSTSLQPRADVPPPPRPDITWEQYITSPSPPPTLGRSHIEKIVVKELKAMVAMSEEFPLPVNVFVDILEMLSPFKHIGKLKEFCEAKLPVGFPVKLEIPLLPTISAKVNFDRFEWRDDFTPKLFTIPRHYGEDPKRFKNL